MRQFKYWAMELWLVGGSALALWLLGLVFDFGLQFLAFALAAYLGWHLYHLYKLQQWLSTSRKAYPPTAIGIWNDIYHQFYLLQKRNRHAKKKLAGIIGQFRASTEASPDGAVVLGEYGEILWFNKAAETLLGLHKRDAGRRLTNFLRHPKFVDYFDRADFAQALVIKSPINLDVTLSIRITPYSEQQQLVIVRDVTRLYKLEQIRRDFVANVSHEMRTPLTVLAGYLEVFYDMPDLPPPMQKPVQQMFQQATRMRNLVDDLLLLSKLESGTRHNGQHTVDVPQLIHTIVDEALLLSDGKHRIDTDINEELTLLGDEKELRSAFSNLIFNAVRYTPEGGRVAIEWRADGTTRVFSVTDTGQGIEAHHIPRLTERFYRVDVGRSREVGGTGLGLAIVKHVLERHGGELKITSTVGEGSCFTCLFPPESV